MLQVVNKYYNNIFCQCLCFLGHEFDVIGFLFLCVIVSRLPHVERFMVVVVLLCLYLSSIHFVGFIVPKRFKSLLSLFYIPVFCVLF